MLPEIGSDLVEIEFPLERDERFPLFIRQLNFFTNPFDLQLTVEVR